MSYAGVIKISPLFTWNAFIIHLKVGFEVIWTRFVGIKVWVGNSNFTLMTTWTHSISICPDILGTPQVSVIAFYAPCFMFTSILRSGNGNNLILGAPGHKLLILAELFEAWKYNCFNFHSSNLDKILSKKDTIPGLNMVMAQITHEEPLKPLTALRKSIICRQFYSWGIMESKILEKHRIVESLISPVEGASLRKPQNEHQNQLNQSTTMNIPLTSFLLRPISEDTASTL